MIVLTSMFGLGIVFGMSEVPGTLFVRGLLLAGPIGSILGLLLLVVPALGASLALRGSAERHRGRWIAITVVAFAGGVIVGGFWEESSAFKAHQREGRYAPSKREQGETGRTT